MFKTNFEKLLAEAEFKRMEKMKKIKRRKKGSTDAEPSILEEELEELSKVAEPAILPMIDEVSKQIEEFRVNTIYKKNLTEEFSTNKYFHHRKTFQS